MTWILETPLPTLIIGGLTLAILIGGWMQTQRRELILAIGAVVVIIVGLFVLERSIVTDREAVEATIFAIAREAEANDVPALARRFHSSASHHRDRLEVELVLYQVNEVNIPYNPLAPNLKIEVDRRTVPPSAVARFNCNVVISDRAGVMKEVRVPRHIVATFLWEDGEWRCSDYEHMDIREGMRVPEAR